MRAARESLPAPCATEHTPIHADEKEQLALLRFGALEGRIMQALWCYEEVTPADLHLLLGDAAISQDVLRSLLEKLHLKHLVRFRRVHRTVFYRATIDRARFIHILRCQLAEFFGDSAPALLDSISDG